MLFILVFGVWAPNTFLTTFTVKAIAGEQAVTAIIALGLLFPVAAGALDLSVASIVGFSALFVAWLMGIHGLDTVPAILLTLFVGVVIGVCNGVMVVIFRISSIIATLATFSVLTGLTSAVSAYEIGNLPATFKSIGQNSVAGLAPEFWYMLVLAVVLWYVLEHTPLGRRIYATGGGAEAARLAGVRVKRLTFATFVVSAVVASAAGILVTAELGAGDPTVGPGYLLPVFAAVFLGATQFKSRPNVWGTVVAVFVLATGVQGLQLVSNEFWVADVFNGVALAAAVGLAGLGLRRR